MMLKVSSLEPKDVEGEWAHLRQDAYFNFRFPEFRRMFKLTDPGNDKIVAVIGASLISKGVWEGWVFTGPDVKKYAKRLVKEVRDFSDWALTDGSNHGPGIHRLQIAVLEENRKWAEAIGFQFEGIVKNYHSNKDHFMYIKVVNNGR